jgi:DNA repair protein RadD
MNLPLFHAGPHSAYQERWYQAQAVDAIWDYFSQGNNGNPVVALPTAAGKTHIISNFMKKALYYYPQTTFGVVTHVKELIEQNADKFSKAWPHAPFGIHSAGLKTRDYMQPIIFGGVQSMVKNPEIFGRRDIMFIDECHLVSPNEESNYQTLIKEWRKINPYMKVVGLSATIFRQGIGYITDEHEGRIFHDICYNLCTIEGFARLIAEGYLSPLIPKRTNIEIDTSSLSLGSNGDFNQKQLAASSTERVMYAALCEALPYGANRRSWLAFASGIENCEKIANMLNQMGISATFVHSKLKDPNERDRRIKAHKNGEVRCLVGNNIFTTGYDHPPLDFIIDLQPTMSIPKHVQKYGRGMRISPETYKENCLVLDFGGNVRRCGPVNDPYIPRRKGQGGGDVPIKVCEHCGTYNHISARICDGCGMPFEFETKIVKKASTEEILKSDLPIIEIFPVDSVYYWKYTSKTSGLLMLAATYWSGLQRFTDYVSVENPKAKHFYYEWWRQRHAVEPPETVDECLKYIAELRTPVRIHVWVNNKQQKITRVEW